MKTCTQCGVEKPLAEFASKSSPGRHCKQCLTCRERKSRYSTSEKGREAEKRKRSQPWHREMVARQNASEAGKARNHRYNKTDKRKVASSRYEKTEKGKRNQRKYALLCKYGLTLEEHAEMLELQGGVCAICGQEETRTVKGKVQRLCVDHCHETGRVRGLLCSRCNAALGLFDDDSGRLQKAIGYLHDDSPDSLEGAIRLLNESGLFG